MARTTPIGRVVRVTIRQHMDRRIIFFPAIAATAWAQQSTPAAPEAEKALRERVEQFYKLMVEKKFRQAEAMVAEDSRDYYYNGKKPDLSDPRVTNIAFEEGGRIARVTVMAKTTVMMMTAGLQVFDLAQITTWKEENGLWVWFIDPNAPIQTPFGPVKLGAGNTGSLIEQLKAKRPTAESLAAQVKIDRTNVVLGPSSPVQTATITNDLPGGVDLSLDEQVSKIKGLTVQLSTNHLNQGEKAEVRLEASADARISDTVRVLVNPLNLELDIHVQTQ